MDQDAAASIGLALAAIVGVSLALSQAIGGLLVYLTEALKATGKIREGYAGIVTLVLGIILGSSLSMLAEEVASTGYGLGTMALIGAFGGALMAAGAVKTYKAMGEVNVKETTPERTDLATMTDLDNAMAIVALEARMHATNGQSPGPAYYDPAPGVYVDDLAEPEALKATGVTTADVEAALEALREHDTYQADPDTPNVFPAPPLPPEPDENGNPAPNGPGAYIDLAPGQTVKLG